MAGITGTLLAICVWLPANAVSQMLARNYLISPRVTSGEPITSTSILNEKKPRRQASGLWLNINTPGKDWGGAFRALTSGRYRSIVRGSSPRKARLVTGLPIITALAAASAARAPRAHSTGATRRRRTRLGDGEKVRGEPQGPGGGQQLQPARDCVSRDQIASGSASRSSPQARIGRSLRRQILHRGYRANHARWLAGARTELSGRSLTIAVCGLYLP
jgi:hypothetical protein